MGAVARGDHIECSARKRQCFYVGAVKLDVGYAALRSQPVALFEHGCSEIDRDHLAYVWCECERGVSWPAAGVKYALAAGQFG